MIDPSPSSIVHRLENFPRRETFIPLRHDDLVRLLQVELGLNPYEADHFRRLSDRLQAIFHGEHLNALVAVETLYSPLDPDCELTTKTPLDAPTRTTRTDRLFKHFGELLQAAHYQRLSHDELRTAIQLSSQWGIKLDVDFDIFERLEIHARGYRLVEVQRRRWQRFFRKETIQLPEFHRLVLAFRIRAPLTRQQELDPDAVYLKMFKNIPETELEVLLPGTRVKLSPIDRGKILFPTLSGAAPALYKLYRTILVIGVAATLAKLWGIVFGVVALISYIVKSFLTYFRTREKYQFELTRSLYVKNLDNNAGVLYRVLNEAREQELGETILAYSLLWKHRNQPELTGEWLDRCVEQFLQEQTGADVDFEVHDAVAKLARLGLATTSPEGFWSPTDLPVATSELNASWRKLFQNRLEAASDGEGSWEAAWETNLFTGP